jgi:hypothetical protein
MDVVRGIIFCPLLKIVPQFLGHSAHSLVAILTELSRMILKKLHFVQSIFMYFIWLESRGSVVGIATGYGLDDRRVGVRVPVGSRNFFSPRLPTSSSVCQQILQSKTRLINHAHPYTWQSYIRGFLVLKRNGQFPLSTALSENMWSFASMLTNVMELSPSWEAASHELLKNFPAFYGTRRFINVFTRAFHWSLSWARPIQSVLHPSSLRSILILCIHLRLGLPSGLFPYGFPTSILYTFLFAPFMLHILLIWSSLSFQLYLAKSTSYEATHYAILFCLHTPH